MPVDILICDDHRLFTDSLEIALTHRGYHVVAPTYDTATALEVVSTVGVDVCLLDLHFPNADGLEAIGPLRSISSRTHVVVISASPDPDLAARAITKGAVGFTGKHLGVDHICKVIEQVMSGEVVTDTCEVGPKVRGPYRKMEHPVARFLTNRELEVLARLVEGQDTARLAQEMGITYATARSHIQNVLTKLGVNSKLAAVAFAIANGLLPLPEGAAS